jgi:hypothetical protein
MLREEAGPAIRQSRRFGYFFLADLGAAFFADRVFFALVAFVPLFAEAVFLLAVFFTAIGCSPQPKNRTSSAGAKMPADTTYFFALEAFLVAPAFFFAPVFLTDFFAAFLPDFFAAMVFALTRMGRDSTDTNKPADTLVYLEALDPAFLAPAFFALFLTGDFFVVFFAAFLVVFFAAIASNPHLSGTIFRPAPFCRPIRFLSEIYSARKDETGVILRVSLHSSRVSDRATTAMSPETTRFRIYCRLIYSRSRILFW